MTTPVSEKYNNSPSTTVIGSAVGSVVGPGDAPMTDKCRKDVWNPM